MKIKDLIEKLKKYDENTLVFCQDQHCDPNGDWFTDFETNEVYKEKDGVYITLTEL